MKKDMPKPFKQFWYKKKRKTSIGSEEINDVQQGSEQWQHFITSVSKAAKKKWNQ
ncbi:hypothetical protein [Bacillus sp. FJAT-45350]|uniref:hypothetical protein n=1 Tax=Bacillus sp. FJAT-45350 TaxID=2011014 RepID=UPI0015C8743A|nr:hypothetical protein [Bacillus sp. FJAT-45350]